MKYCIKCGASNADSAKFCTECGAALAVEETNNTDTIYTYGEASAAESDIITYEPDNNSDNTEDKYAYTYNADSKNDTFYHSVNPNIAPRNIIVAIILSFVTCGIYQIYWMIKMNDEVNTLASEPNAASGIMVFLFTLITCGIYGFFWMYKMGERCDRIKGSVGGSSAVLYLILSLLGLGIVSYCLIQDTINKAV